MDGKRETPTEQKRNTDSEHYQMSFWKRSYTAMIEFVNDVHDKWDASCTRCNDRLLLTNGI